MLLTVLSIKSQDSCCHGYSKSVYQKKILRLLRSLGLKDTRLGLLIDWGDQLLFCMQVHCRRVTILGYAAGGEEEKKKSMPFCYCSFSSSTDSLCSVCSQNKTTDTHHGLCVKAFSRPTDKVQKCCQSVKLQYTRPHPLQCSILTLTHWIFPHCSIL